MASVKLILRTDKLNSKEEAPLYIRLIKDRKTRFISLGQWLNPKHWNETEQKVKKSFPNSARMNAFLAEKVSEAQGKVLEVETKNKEISTKQLKVAVMGKEPTAFFAYADKKIENIKNRLRYSSYSIYKVYLDKFRRFVGNNDLYFDEIDPTYLKKYESHMMNTLKNDINTVEYSFRIIKLIFKEAITEDVVSYANYPFLKFRVKKKPTNRNFLNEIQYQAFIGLDMSDQKIMVSKARDMFEFGTHAAGLRISDLITLRMEDVNLELERLSKYINKTGRVHSFKLSTRAKEILNKYITPEMQPKDYIFGMLNNSIDCNDDTPLLKQKLDIARKRLNDSLKVIQKAIDLPFALSTHCARHTFATRALNKGMRIEHVSKLLDHKDIQTTQIYAKIVAEELDKAMEIFG